MALGAAPTILVATAVGGAAAAALEPVFEPARQEAWQGAPNRLLDPGVIARLVARGAIDLKPATYDDVNREGFGNDKLDALIYLEQVAPGLAEALRLWRLELIGDDLWSRAVTKAGYDPRYIEPLGKLKTAELLGIGDIAYAVVRGILPTPSYVPVPPPSSGDKVPRFPVVDIDPEEYAARLGFTPEQLQIMVGRSGLSMAPGMAANALFRGIIGKNDYTLAIAEGDLRTEWAEAVREVSREILTSHDAAELQLRGYLNPEERRGYTEAHGMSDAESDLLYDLLGRSIPVHQITTGEARGGTFEGPADTIPKAYLQSLQRGNLRPEYYNLAYANRYSYPSAFFIRLLLAGGELTAAQGEQIFKELGWPPALATLVANSLATTKAGASDPHVSKAESQLWTTTHRSYVAEMTGDTDASARFDALGIPAASQAQILKLWDLERSLIRKQLTPAQIKKAIAEKLPNIDTGAAWTVSNGVDALTARGYSLNDAQTFLSE